MKVAEADDLNEIKQAGSLLTSDLEHFTVGSPSVLPKQFSDALSLIIGAGLEIGAVGGAVDGNQPMLAAAD